MRYKLESKQLEKIGKDKPGITQYLEFDYRDMRSGIRELIKKFTMKKIKLHCSLKSDKSKTKKRCS